MSETTWTPGEWKHARFMQDGEPLKGEALIAYVTDCIRAGGDEFYGVYVEDYGDGKPADICHTGNGPNSAAHARLISAAPELYEALALLWREVCQSGNAMAGDFGWPEARAKTLAALAKASPSQAQEEK